jgi:diacylglycerol kinase family enzyme
LLLIANPASSQFTGGIHRSVIRILSKRFEVEAVWPQSPPHSIDLAAQAVRQGAGMVVAMGGDGVAHHVAQALAETPVPMGLIPTGTTNVLARLLGVPRRPISAARLLAGSHLKRDVPLLSLVLENRRGTARRWAVFSAGFGFDAEVVGRAEAEPFRKYRFGGIHYARTALATALGTFRRRRPHIQVTAEDHKGNGVAALAQFHHVYTYFGKVPVRFAADPPNPLTMLVVNRLRSTQIPAIARRALTRADLSALKGFDVWTDISKATVEAEPPVAAQADGEVLGMVERAELSLFPKAMRVVVPLPSGPFPQPSVQDRQELTRDLSLPPPPGPEDEVGL